MVHMHNDDICFNPSIHPVKPGMYRGIVLKHLSRGKCKIWVPGVYPDEWQYPENFDRLPDAEQASPISFGTNEGLGVFSYPNINSIVWVFFQNDDQNMPVYFAAALGGQNAADQWSNVRIKPNVYPEDAYVHKIAVKNSNITIYETGVIKVETTDGRNQSCTLSMDDHGNIIIESTSTITLKTKQLLLDADTQVDIKAPNIKQSASIHEVIKSPAIELDSSNGRTVILSRNGWSKVF